MLEPITPLAPVDALMKKIISTYFLFLFPDVSGLPAQTLDLPPRSPTASKGSDFARSIRDLPLKEREAAILAEVFQGNVPRSLRTLVPVVVSAGPNQVTYQVTPDYLAVGSSDDFFLTPLSPETAQAIADRLGCLLPTPKMVDDIYAASTVKLTPLPIPPSPAMTTVPVFLKHHDMVQEQRKGQPSGVLAGGHKKDVVIANQVFASPGKVAIYGWHKADGRPIQPLYTGHTSAWVDYSHGIRLVSRRMLVNGQPRNADLVLADPELAPLLNRDGVMRRTRYPVGAGSTTGTSTSKHVDAQTRFLREAVPDRAYSRFLRRD